MHHERGLRRELEKQKMAKPAIEQLCRDLKEQPGKALLSEADRSMIDYAVLLTNEPQKVSRAEVDRLRQNGFDDLAIHDLCCIVGYFAFVNRIADGLGVELE